MYWWRSRGSKFVSERINISIVYLNVYNVVTNVMNQNWNSSNGPGTAYVNRSFWVKNTVTVGFSIFFSNFPIFLYFFTARPLS